MEDKRIIRTKHNLKDAMIRMLSIEDFEHISVTELCKEAKVSRITFYSHYSDKQSLLDDIFNDMRSIGREDYYRRPVSYTHLDVYKRQVQNNFFA